MAWTRTYHEAEPQRVNRWLAQSGVCSRREAEGLIARGLVSIDGQIVSDAGRKIEPGQTLTLADAATGALSEALTVILHKPVGVVSAQPEPGQVPAIRLLTRETLVGECPAIPDRDSRLAPVGRLDMDSRGLLILSEDGVVAKAVIGPQSELEKEYRVAVIGELTEIAAEMLDAPAESLAFGGGRFTAPASGRSVDLFDIAKAAYALNSIDDSLRGPLAGEHSELFRAPGYPYGTAVCELEIDPATGRIELRRWSAVDDVGRAVNPMILDGQTHGAAVQGIGQLLWEHCATDPETGQVIAGSFMDYAMPRADWLISFDTELMEVPSTSNPLGVRAGGEGGTTPALAAGVNAIVDALADYNVEHVDMPATSEKIWRLIREKRAC